MAERKVTTAESPAPPSAPAEAQAGGPTVHADVRPEERLLEAEVLVEDVSIDGMCGVY